MKGLTCRVCGSQLVIRAVVQGKTEGLIQSDGQVDWSGAIDYVHTCGYEISCESCGHIECDITVTEDGLQARSLGDEGEGS